MGLEDREWFRADQKQRLGQGAFLSLRLGRFKNWYVGAVELAGGIALAALLPIHRPKLGNSPGVALAAEPDSNPWPFPPQGAVQFHVGNLGGQLGTLTIVAPSVGPERHFAVRVRDWYRNAPISTLYLRSSETLNVDVSAGVYRLSFAEGTGWQGYDRLFGLSTTFSSGIQPVVMVPVNGGVFRFRLVMTDQPGGNFEHQPSTASSF